MYRSRRYGTYSNATHHPSASPLATLQADCCSLARPKSSKHSANKCNGTAYGRKAAAIVLPFPGTTSDHATALTRKPWYKLSHFAVLRSMAEVGGGAAARTHMHLR